MDCPELVCDDCQFDIELVENFDAIEQALLDALGTKHSRKHDDAKTAVAVRHALAHLDVLGELLFAGA